jgi:hypothetical protein
MWPRRKKDGVVHNRSRLRRWFRRLAVAGLLLGLLLGGFLLWVYLTCFATPPPLDERPAILDRAPVERAGGRVFLGECWFREDPGCSILYLEGDPFTIGYANATLTAKFLEVQERSLIETAREHFPSWFSFMAVATFVLVNNRNLPSYVPLEYQYEILGLSRGGRDPFPGYGPRYHRILNYHAAHDISHLVFDRPVLGCTAFAARGKATRDGHLLLARNFDFEAGRHFDTNKIVGLYRPSKGNAFLSVCWPGMAGAVTGFNEARIYCSLNGAHSEDRRNIGKPVSLVVREVLQYATTLEEATRRIRAAPVFVSDSYLVADGKSGDAVVVEKSPEKVAVREMEGGLIIQANHFETGTFASDRGNRDYIREGTSLSRRRRLTELVSAASGRLDPATAVHILRDRRGPGGVKLAAGHRGAVNPMIATHSTVVDLTAGILWVSRGPHQLGRFEAFAIESFPAPAAPAVPEDAALENGVYENLCRAREILKKAKREFADEGSLAPSTLADLRRALDLDPGAPDIHDLLAQALEAGGRTAEALEHYRAALASSPPFRDWRDRIEKAIRRLEREM